MIFEFNHPGTFEPFTIVSFILPERQFGIVIATLGAVLIGSMSPL